ncbi:MAG: HAD-IA family hydrolase [Burkholderiaceae bacterium]
MAELKALLWDVDGVLAESERDGHRVAFNSAFQACGLPWRWDEAHYGALLRITGGRERLLHDMRLRSDAPALPDEREALVRELHRRKNGFYAELVREGRITLRGGVPELMQECRERGTRMGIVTTTSRSNVDALLRFHLGQSWTEWFSVVVCGEDVQRKKPDPQAYQIALSALDAFGIGPLQAVAIEDSPGGAAAARAADIPVVVTRSHYFADASIDSAIAIGPGLHERRGWRPALDAEPGDSATVSLADIEGWAAQMESVSQFGDDL